MLNIFVRKIQTLYLVSVENSILDALERFFNKNVFTSESSNDKC